MAKKIAPLRYYQNRFNASWLQLYKLIEADTKDLDEEDSPKLKAVNEYLDSLAQLLDELVFAVNPPKKHKKSKKHKK